MWHPFDNISEELIDTIVSLCGRRTLASLCLVSKQLNRIAIPYLYANLSLRADYDEEGDLVHLLPLAYQIFASPARAALVKTVALPDGWGGYREAPRIDGLERRSWPSFGTPETERLLRTKCHDYALDDKEAERLYEKMLAADNSDVVITLLIANLPNLEKLDLNFRGLRDHENFIAMFERIGNRLKPFDSIPLDPLAVSSDPNPAIALSKPIEVFIRESDPGNTMYLASFFHLPQLRSIYAFKFGDYHSPPRDSPFALLCPRSCAVQHIELRDCKLDNVNLQHLVDAIIPGQLKTFLYEIGGAFAWCTIDHPAIMRSLEPHQDDLETLELSHEELYPFEPGWSAELPDKPFAVSFASFKSLRRLRVAPVFIWGHDGFHVESEMKKPSSKDMLWQALPECIEELSVTRAQQQPVSGDREAGADFVPHLLIPALMRVAERRSEAFSYLRSIHVEFPPHKWKAEWLDSLADYCQIAEAKGIHCTIVFTHKWRQIWTNDKSHMSETVERHWGWNGDITWSDIHYAFNREWRKHRIDAATENDLAGTMRALKDGAFAEKKD